MRPFRSSPLSPLSRRPLASASPSHACHVVKRRPRPRLLSSAASRRASQRASHDAEPKKVMVHSLGNRFTTRRFVSLSLYAVAAVAMFRFIGRKLGDVEDPPTDLDDHHTDQFAEGDDESIFIALEFPRPLPRKFYKQSDPDWKEFSTFSRNRNRHNAIQKELAERVGREVAKHPQMSRVLGKDIKTSQYWLDFKYPDSPPPEYARTGIEISDEYVALSTQVIPHSYYVQLSHVLWPKALFGAAITSLNLFAHVQLIKIKDLFGWELSQADRQIQVLSFAEKSRKEVESLNSSFNSAREKNDAIRARLQQRLKDAQNPRGAANKPPVDALSADPATAPSTSDAAPASSSMWTALKRSRSSSSSTAEGSTTSSQILNWLPSPPIPTPKHILKPLTSSTDLNLAWKSFASVLSTNWAKAKMDTMPKGSFYVMGQVEISGDRARCKADVNAAYDPKRAKFTFIVTDVRHVWEHNQSAKGGP